MKEHQIEITVHHTFIPSPIYTYRYRSELINAENADYGWSILDRP